MDPIDALKKMLEEVAKAPEAHSMRELVEAAEAAQITVSSDAKRMKKGELIAMLRAEVSTTDIVDLDGSEQPVDGEAAEDEDEESDESEDSAKALPEEIYADEPPKIVPIPKLANEGNVLKYAHVDGLFRVGPAKVALNKGQLQEMPKYAAEFLQARGKVGDAPPPSKKK